VKKKLIHMAISLCWNIIKSITNGTKNQQNCLSKHTSQNWTQVVSPILLIRAVEINDCL